VELIPELRASQAPSASYAIAPRRWRRLRPGRIAAAGLDVFEGEPKIHPGYRTLPNTFLLPHLGSATRETREAMGFRALDNLDAFFAGRPPRDRIA
jgi:glyoxylate reductase